MGASWAHLAKVLTRTKGKKIRRTIASKRADLNIATLMNSSLLLVIERQNQSTNIMQAVVFAGNHCLHWERLNQPKFSCLTQVLVDSGRKKRRMMMTR
jgi:hypothetical protein